MNDNKFSLDNRIDYGIILPVFVLCIIGLISQYVALSLVDGENILYQMLKQALWLSIGLFAVIVLMQFNIKVWWKITPALYALGLVLMILPLRFYDPNVAALTGAKNWVHFAGLSFQPSELMKISYLLLLAYITTRHNRENKHEIKSDFLLIAKLLLATLPVVILLKLQNDFGTLLVFIAIFCGVVLISGISWKILLPSIITAIVLIAGILSLVATDVGRELLFKFGVKEYQLSRIDSWLNPFHDTTGVSYQQAQSLTAIGSGGLTGKGFNVSQVDVPVRESDMIFTVIAENFGFVGGALVIFMYLLLIYRLIRVCLYTNNVFSTYISTGIIMMILFHVFENIGASIGLLPLTGIPLPFISQGGSSLLGNMIGIGIMLSMKFNNDVEFDH
ncbi:FtsW/RodA/SpoVE family cell cycle protein [Vagococcus xieshaowenii]|uniref:Rod shape-determining protein RodA n=1 Tax=Vagococcus xieshaowenii TaxID=2562451 RepID=A0AAJ5EGM2_9ENTE|nr:FtsW/RodA/SpoVE family cell cycle protein [Vagococcus xieshaowenii]QCA28446.1 rod shape-determining protein RodA [Vagococcus xieshaowenii]TFZ42798.1 rod shape-determining protein RodA [Vagococcus xieshaowenii]